MDVEVTYAFGPQYMTFLAFVGRVKTCPCHLTWHTVQYINIGPQLETIRGDYANRRAQKNRSYHKRRRNGDHAYRCGVVPRGKGVERME
jgi:hypothetical protein